MDLAPFEKDIDELLDEFSQVTPPVLFFFKSVGHHEILSFSSGYGFHLMFFINLVKIEN